MTAPELSAQAPSRGETPAWQRAKSLEAWWTSYLSPSVPAAGSLRGVLRRAPDAAVMIDPHFVRLIQAITETQESSLAFDDVRTLLAAARFVSLFRENGSRPLAELIRAAGSDISLNRRKRLVSAESQEEFHAQIVRIQHLLPGTPRISNVAHLFLTWPNEDARLRFAFDALSQKA